MYRYPIKLTMRSGEVVEGVAVNTERNNAHEECILVSIDSVEALTVLDDIAKLEVCVENPHFEEIFLAIDLQVNSFNCIKESHERARILEHY